jgi:hypothetical protein
MTAKRITVFIVTPCSRMKLYRRFGETLPPSTILMMTALRGNRGMITKHCKIRCYHCDDKLKAGRSSKMLINLYQVTRRHIPEAVIVAKLLFSCTGVLISPEPDQEGNKLQRQTLLIFIYPIYNHNWRNISTVYIYIKQD